MTILVHIKRFQTMKKVFLLSALLVFILSCSNSEKYQLISGSWKCSSWINKASGIDKCNNNVSFDFNADKSYQSILGKEKASGEYSIQDDLLYITPQGKMEFAVKIIKLKSDTLTLLMNQAGNKEILTLVRRN